MYRQGGWCYCGECGALVYVQPEPRLYSHIAPAALGAAGAVYLQLLFVLMTLLLYGWCYLLLLLSM